MNCPKCGTPNPDGTSFCSGCGNPLAAAPQQFAQPQQPQQYAQPQYQQPQPQYGQPQYQQPYGAPQQYARPRAPFQWYDASLPLVKRINRSALEALVAYFLCMFMPVVFSSGSGANIFDMGALGSTGAALKIGAGGFIAMWIIDIIALIGGCVVSVLGIHLGTLISGGVLFITSLITVIFAGVDASQMRVSIGIGAIFMMFAAITITVIGVLDFLKFQKKQKGVR